MDVVNLRCGDRSQRQHGANLLYAPLGGPAAHSRFAQGRAERLDRASDRTEPG